MPASASRCSSRRIPGSSRRPYRWERRWSSCTPAATARSKGRPARRVGAHREAAALCELGLGYHAGHGLNYGNQPDRIANVRELNIGHFLVGEAIFVGFVPAIREMRRLMDEARR